MDDVSIIPVRLVYNWDARPAVVSAKAKAFLAAVADEPVIDAANLPQGLADFAPDLASGLALRRRLHYLRAYLRTCGRKRGRETVAAITAAMDTPPASLRMAEEPDKFSLAELAAIRNGRLLPILKRAFAIGEAHILGVPSDPGALGILARSRTSGE